VTLAGQATTAYDQTKTRRTSGGRRLYWWGELLAVVGFYLVYSLIRNLSEGGTGAAFQHALDVIDWEKDLGIYIEESIQDAVLSLKPLVIALNYMYGSLHFIVTPAVLIFLFRRFSDSYRFWRNTLAVTTALGLVGFILWPLMPPRLLPIDYGFVDTLARYPTIWSFQSGAVQDVSNQYAAMPSLHFAWALFCALALWPRFRNPGAKALIVTYPVVTLVSIVLTGNHFILDAVGGVVVLGAGLLLSRWISTRGRRRRTTPAPI
jgi:hypothetical protein